MKIKYFIIFLIIFASHVFSYEIKPGLLLMGGGIGAKVNVLRYQEVNNETPKGQMPLSFLIDYILDPSIGFFASFSPMFAADSVQFASEMGGKYWLSFLNAPIAPYFSFAFNPSIMFPVEKGKNHYNMGLSFGCGLKYFVLADFLVGIGFNLNPSVAFVGRDSSFEFSASSFFDLSFRI